MTSQLENRSLDRGITVLWTLAGGGAMSLHQLHQKTGLAKSTLRRLLATLVARRIVRIGLGDRLYRTNVALPDLTPPELTPRAARLVEAAMPHMIELTRKIGWPSDLHLFDRNRMRVVESTRTLSPYHIHRGSIDITVNVFGSAGGRAFLSALEPAKIDSIIADIGADPELGMLRFGLTRETLDTELAEVRRKQFAKRHPAFPALTTSDDRLRVMAVPLVPDGKSIGALTLIWPRGYIDYDAFAAIYLPDLRDTSARIADSLV